MADSVRGPGGAQLVVLGDAEELAREAARRLVDGLARAIEQRGQAHVALTGGSSAVTLYRELAAEWRTAVDWSQVHLWWGDERFVPVDHPDSNTGLAYATLLAASPGGGASGAGSEGAGLGIHAENVHPLEIDEAMSESDAAGLVAERYAEELAEVLPYDADGVPAFDVILLGVGSDGHVLSVFPDSPALQPAAPLVLAVPAPEHIAPHLPRVTLNPRLLESAGLVLVMVPGAGKAEVVSRILGRPDGGASEMPARLALRPNAVWLLDRQSAAGLDVIPGG